MAAVQWVKQLYCDQSDAASILGPCHLESVSQISDIASSAAPQVCETMCVMTAEDGNSSVNLCLKAHI